MEQSETTQNVYGKYLHQLIENFPSLEELSLNDINMKYYNLYDAILPCSKTLKSLKLYDTGIGKEEQLETFKTLQELTDIDGYSNIFEDCSGLPCFPDLCLQSRVINLKMLIKKDKVTDC